MTKRELRLDTLELSPLRKKILEKIVKEGIEIVSYYHPEMQLGKELTKDYSKTIAVFNSLEDDGAVNLDPSLKFKRFSIMFIAFYTRCGYQVLQEKAKALYDSIKPENQKEQG